MKRGYSLLLVGLLSAMLPMQVLATEASTVVVPSTEVSTIEEPGAELSTDELYAGFEGDEDSITEELIADIKEKLANGELETEEEIRKAILEGINKLGVELSEEKIDNIVAAVNKLKDLELNPAKTVSEIIGSAVGRFFQNIGNYIVEFFKNLFL